MRCRQRLDIPIDVALSAPPNQPRCFALPFFVWEWGRRGKLFGKARRVFYSENGTNTTLRMQSKTMFYYPFLVTKQVTVER
jgi:hypothetical protein